MHEIRRTLTIGLVAVMLFACRGGGGGHGSSDTGDTTPQTSVPAELVGTWYHGSVSPANFYDPGNGHWDNAYGDGMFYTFTADGRFEFGYRIYTSTFGCNDVAMFWKTGTVAVDAATQSLTIHPTEAVLHSTDDCHEEWNYTKNIAKDPETLIWQFGDDGWGTTALLLQHPDENPSAFYAWEF